MTDTGSALARLAAKGWRAAAVEASRVAELAEELAARRHGRELDVGVCEAYAAYLQAETFDVPTGMRSLVVVANPQPQVEIIFQWRGRQRALTLPPTYRYRQPDAAVVAALGEALGSAHVARAVVPVKLLAIRAGLGSYGRHNLCLVPGLGSFHRLAAFYTDVPLAQDTWQPAQLHERCMGCRDCMRACPTGAIVEERWVVHAERCLTFMNEWPGAWPEWLSPKVHNAIVGCMLCQRACPENAAVRNWRVWGGEFTEDETELILAGTPLDALPEPARAKAEAADLDQAWDVLPRNLAALLNDVDFSPRG
mgnify:CR=1 FL=1